MFVAIRGAPVKRMITVNALAYIRSRPFQSVLGPLGIKHPRTNPRHPWQNGRTERFNRTLQEGWAYRGRYTSAADRTAALRPWLDFHNHRRRHCALEAIPLRRRLTTYTSGRPTCWTYSDTRISPKPESTFATSNRNPVYLSFYWKINVCSVRTGHC